MAPPRSISCIIRISSLNFLSRCGFSQGWLQSWATLNPLIFHVTPYVFIYLSIYLSNLILSYLILPIYLSIYLYIYSIIYTYTDIGSPLQMDHATCFFSAKARNSMFFICVLLRAFTALSPHEHHVGEEKNGQKKGCTH